MSDQTGDMRDDVREIEALLRELDVEDLEPTPPPPDVWAGIEATLTDQPAAAPVISLDQRRRRTRWLLSAAAATLFVIAGAVWIGNRSGSEEIVSTAVLAHDPDAFDPLGADASATARLVERDGHFEIRLTDAELPALTGTEDLELWLIQPDDDGNPVDIAPVALVDSTQPGAYRVPDGLDPSSHFVVDISAEPRDGDAAHSGRSILRGALEPD